MVDGTPKHSGHGDGSHTHHRPEGRVETCWDRAAAQGAPCTFGTSGLCCRNCYMGPCRITERSPLGVCGANADTIVARNFLREVAAGAAAHAEVARDLVGLFEKVAGGKADGYAISDLAALRDAAADYEAPHTGRLQAVTLAERMLGEFDRRQPLAGLKLATAERQETWARAGADPAGIDKEIVAAFHATVMGVDHDYRSLLTRAYRVALADGWGSSRLGMTACDILFGRPHPVEGAADLGVLGLDTVNVLVHGHNPAVAEMLAAAAKDEDIVQLARQCGAAGGVRLAGMCCTGGGLLARHGIPMAGHFSQQELAIATGAVEMMITDVQCSLPSLPTVAARYHTLIVSVSESARGEGVEHFPLDAAGAREGARELLKRAIRNFRRRAPEEVFIPSHKARLTAGFTPEAIKQALGGTGAPSYRPLLEAMLDGTVRGVAGIVGCSNPRSHSDNYANDVTRELLHRDVLVCATGCAGGTLAEVGLLWPREAMSHAGAGLAEFCRRHDIPPAMHMGSCLDNARLLQLAVELAREAGNVALPVLPIVGVVPELMSEKVATIACYFAASGLDVVLGHPLHVSGSASVGRFLEQEGRESFGGGMLTCPDPVIAATRVLELMDERRTALRKIADRHAAVGRAT